MGTAICAKNGSSIRRKRKRRYSYSEDANEAPAVVEKEPVEVEQEHPSEDNPNVESVEPEDALDSPAFEE
jgi:hypothetical protein